MCKLRALDRRFPPEFRDWVGNLIRLHLWRKAGYELNNEPLGWEEWQALAVINRWYEVKDLESARLTAVSPS